MRVIPAEPVGTPFPDSKGDRPPVIRRNEMVGFVLLALLVIVIVAALYVAKPFFLPIVTAFVVGTMLSPAAGLLEQRRIPRAVSAVLIVAIAFGVVAFIVTLIAAPVVEWSGRLPELGVKLKEKLQAFDGTIVLWQQLQAALGNPDHAMATPIQFPTIEWMQPTYEFLSPTLTEMLLFLVTLVLFIASWKDLRRALVMTFPDRDTRLRALRILNEIEGSLGSYLLTVTSINLGYGVLTGVICWLAGMPNPAALGALAATLNFFPVIGPFVMLIILTLVGIISFPDARRGTVGAARLRVADLRRRSFRDAGDHRPATVFEHPGGVHHLGVLDLAVGPDGRLPRLAAVDRRPGAEGASVSRRCAEPAGIGVSP